MDMSARDVFGCNQKDKKKIMVLFLPTLFNDVLWLESWLNCQTALPPMGHQRCTEKLSTSGKISDSYPKVSIVQRFRCFSHNPHLRASCSNQDLLKNLCSELQCLGFSTWICSCSGVVWIWNHVFFMGIPYR